MASRSAAVDSSPVEEHAAMSPAPTTISGATTSSALAVTPNALVDTVIEPDPMPTTRPEVESILAIVVSESHHSGSWYGAARVGVALGPARSRNWNVSPISIDAFGGTITTLPGVGAFGESVVEARHAVAAQQQMASQLVRRACRTGCTSCMGRRCNTPPDV